MYEKIFGNNRRVLLVDDNKNVIFVFAKLLEGCGFKVLTALSGEEALPLIDSSLHAVVTDMHMYALNGNDIAKAVRNFSSNIITILVYAPKTIEPEKKLFDHIIMKPVDWNLLVSAIV